MLKAVIRVVQSVATTEVMPRFMRVKHERKADRSVYTEADLAAQKALVAALTALADYPVIAEEMTENEQVEKWLASAGDVWCVDPIDGTSNFVNGLPYFAISVALLRAGRPVLGVIFDPCAKELFYAEKGHGAFLNDRALPLKTEPPLLQNAIAGIDFKRLPRELRQRLAVEMPFASQRNFGASVLEWCYAAAGRYDVYLHGGQKLWDYAAGALILSEAGGQMSSFEHDDFWQAPLWKRPVIGALDAGLFNQWRDWVRASI
jgi:myo-inositol-1(or 4)-monophosphatase